MDGKIKVTKIGNKLGFVLPEEIAQKMKISENEDDTDTELVDKGGAVGDELY